jgi:hypothetical protein
MRAFGHYYENVNVAASPHFPPGRRAEKQDSQGVHGADYPLDKLV